MAEDNYLSIKAIFLDRDGVINHEQGHITKLSDFNILKGVPEAISKLNTLGIKVIIVTNQSGIARGLLTIGELNEIHEFLYQTLHKNGAHIDDLYYSPWHPDTSIEGGVKDWLGEHSDRKPGAGMLLKGLKKYSINPDQACMIGDSGKDLGAAKAAGVKFLGVVSSKQDELEGKCSMYKSLDDAVNHIIENR